MAARSTVADGVTTTDGTDSTVVSSVVRKETVVVIRRTKGEVTALAPRITCFAHPLVP